MLTNDHQLKCKKKKKIELDTYGFHFIVTVIRNMHDFGGVCVCSCLTVSGCVVT